MVSLGTLVIATSALTSGCGSAPQTCSDLLTCGGSGGEGGSSTGTDVGKSNELACVPSATSAPEEDCGVFVRGSAPEDGKGTKESPFKTFASALKALDT